MLPGVGPGDPRVGADLSVLPWAAVARLQAPGIGRCTAVVVAPHWAATAAHCLGARRLGHVVPPSGVHLLLGYADGRFTRHLVADRIEADPLAAADPAAHRGSDLAFIHVVETLTAILPIDPVPPPPGTALQLGGYGQDRAERLAVDPACTARAMQADADRRPLLVHDCTGTRGTSGGAVLSAASGQWRLAGIQVAGNVAGAGGVAVPGITVARLLAGLD